MALEGLRGYLQIASGLTEVTKARANEVVKIMLTNLQESVDAAGSAAQLRKQMTTLTDELISTGRANRDLLLALIRSEVERTVSRLGLLSNDDLERAKALADSLEARVRDLEDRLLGSRGTAARPGSADTAAAGRPPVASAPPTARRASAKKTGSAKPPAKKATKRSVPGSTAATTKRAAGAAPTKKTTARKTPAKKTPTKTAELRAAPPSSASALGATGDLPPAAPGEVPSGSGSPSQPAAGTVPETPVAAPPQSPAGDTGTAQEATPDGAGEP